MKRTLLYKSSLIASYRAKSPLITTPLFLLTILFFPLPAFTQFAFPGFPMGVTDNYGDTLLNKRAVLLKEGIRQIHAYQNLPEVTKTFASKTVYLNEGGTIDKVTICFAPNKKTNFTFCVQDTIRYDSVGRMIAIQTTDNGGNEYPVFVVGHPNARETTWGTDTVAVWRYFNEKDQLLEFKQYTKGVESESRLFFYNEDGLLDSVRSSSVGTFVFKRKNKGKTKLVEMTNFVGSYTWAYNRSGQCIKSLWILKDRPIHDPPRKGNLKIQINYYYNPNGTLSTVTTKMTDKPKMTMFYSYLK